MTLLKLAAVLILPVVLAGASALLLSPALGSDIHAYYLRNTIIESVTLAGAMLFCLYLPVSAFEQMHKLQAVLRCLVLVCLSSAVGLRLGEPPIQWPY